jgi:hypothetical protein
MIGRPASMRARLTIRMKQSGESEPTSVFAMLAGARCATTQSARPPSHGCTIHSDEPLRVLASLDEARAAIDAAAAAAQRMISIFTPNLEPELYEQSAFLEIIKRFVLSRSFSKVRVLLADRAGIVREDNRFVAMGRRLRSYIDIRHAAESLPARAPAFLVADDRAVVHRLRTDGWDGIADFDNPAVARLYLSEFDSLWSRTTPEDALSAARHG